MTGECNNPRLVIALLGTVSIVLSGGIILLFFFDKKVDGSVTTLAGASIGALGSLLTNTVSRASGQRSGDTVTVRADEALPTKEVATGNGKDN